LLSSTLACDDYEYEPDLIDVERSTAPDSGWLLRVIEDDHALLSVDDFEIAIVLDPNTLAKDIHGVIETQAMVLVEDPIGTPLKVKLKIIVLPAGPTAE
jgi:hypothetical protein